MFFCKNKVMMLALGRSLSDEYKDNLHRVSKRLRGEVGLLFTNRTKEEVNGWFTKYTEMDFARAGNKATLTVNLDPGPLKQFPHSMEPQLRQLGLPTALKKGRWLERWLRVKSSGCFYIGHGFDSQHPHLTSTGSSYSHGATVMHVGKTHRIIFRKCRKEGAFNPSTEKAEASL